MCRQLHVPVPQQETDHFGTVLIAMVQRQTVPQMTLSLHSHMMQVVGVLLPEGLLHMALLAPVACLN